MNKPKPRWRESGTWVDVLYRNQVRANDALIAAAPDLLIALEGLAKWAKEDLRERGIPWCFTSVDAAIAKAKGEKA